MRACEGCRRRKIKCDAATTNTWPCSACVRLKLHCVPPTLNYDLETFQGSMPYESEPQHSHGVLAGASAGRYPQRPPPTQLFSGGRSSSQETTEQTSFDGGTGAYGTSDFPAQPSRQDGPLSLPYNTVHEQPIDTNGLSYRPGVMYSTPPVRPPTATTATSESWQSDPYSSENLSDALGELKIDETGVGVSTHLLFLRCLEEANRFQRRIYRERKRHWPKRQLSRSLMNTCATCHYQVDLISP